MQDKVIKETERYYKNEVTNGIKTGKSNGIKSGAEVLLNFFIMNKENE